MYSKTHQIAKLTRNLGSPPKYSVLSNTLSIILI